MRRFDAGLAVGAACLMLGAPASARTQAGASGFPLDGESEESLQEVARQITNPVSTLSQLTFDNQIVGMGRGGLAGVEPAYTGSLQPAVAVNLSRFGLSDFAWAERFNLVTRLSLPFVQSTPLPPGPGSARETGFGDIELVGVLAPNVRYGFVWGIGPTFIFPSASDSALGQGKWQAGPALLAGHMGRDWTAYLLAQQWWSFAGDGGRPDTNQLCLSYVLLRNLPRRWQVGMQPSMEVDWTASRGNKVSLPVGLGVGKTVRIGRFPVQFWVEADYYPVRPDDLSGPRWGIDLQIIPTLPKPF